MEIEKNIFLKGENISLRRLVEDDINGNYSKWLNDPEITKFNSHGRFPVSVDDLKKYIETTNASKTAITLAIIDNQTAKHIGNISLQHINWIDKNGEIAFLLGERDFWGKGVMLEAGFLLLNHAFKMLNLHRIYCGTSSENIGMQKLAIKLGMTEEGRRVEAMFKNGKYLDILEYGILSKTI